MNDIYTKITQLIKQYNRFIIMTHKNPDLDGISSALCLSNIICNFNKECYIYFNDQIKNNSVLKMLDIVNNNGIIYHETNFNNYLELINNETLIIILDVSNKSIIENSCFLEKTNNILVIDHHIKSNDSIINTVASYINSNLSSIAEFMVGYIKFLNYKIDSTLATSLLAAIEIDTNNFNIKTTDETYKIAAYLMENGADNVLKQEILKIDKDDYLKRQILLKNSFMVNDNLAVCMFDNKEYGKEQLAIAAEELLQFENVDASFVIGKINSTSVGISARSIGKIDVENIMKQLGGGGHTTEAAAEIVDTNVVYVKNKLLNVINEVK